MGIYCFGWPEFRSFYFINPLIYCSYVEPNYIFDSYYYTTYSSSFPPFLFCIFKPTVRVFASSIFNDMAVSLFHKCTKAYYTVSAINSQKPLSSLFVTWERVQFNKFILCLLVEMLFLLLCDVIRFVHTKSLTSTFGCSTTFLYSFILFFTPYVQHIIYPPMLIYYYLCSVKKTKPLNLLQMSDFNKKMRSIKSKS